MTETEQTIYSKQTTSTNNTGLWSFPFDQEEFWFLQMIWTMDRFSCVQIPFTFCTPVTDSAGQACQHTTSEVTIFNMFWIKCIPLYCFLSDNYYNISHLGKSQSPINLAPIVVITDIVNSNPISVQNLTGVFWHITYVSSTTKYDQICGRQTERTFKFRASPAAETKLAGFGHENDIGSATLAYCHLSGWNPAGRRLNRGLILTQNLPI